MDHLPRPSTISRETSVFHEQERAALALTAAGMGEFEWNAADDRYIISPRMAEITGLAAGPMLARGREALFEFVHPQDLETLRRSVIASLERDERYDVRFRMIRPDTGKVQWMESSAVNVRSADGRVEMVIGVVRDVTSRKGDENEREALVAELDHRVKNVLATVQSLAAQSARRTVSLEAFLKTFAGRLDAMAAAHTLLTSTRWRGAEIGHIAAAELGGLALGQARWEGPDLVLNPRATNALTLALHELSTNAVKYGALSQEAGRIELTWTSRTGGGFEMIWVERGGPPVAPPARRGFGATLLERVTGRELGGSVSLEFRPEGVRAVLIAAADALIDDEPPRAPAPPVRIDGDPHGHAGESVGDQSDDIRGIRVLIVEDAVLLALELEAGLVEAGAQVVGVAANLEEGRSMLDLHFDVAVVDADLNGRSAEPLAALLLARQVPYIFASALEGDVATAASLGAPVVRKPYNIRQIAAAIAGVLDSRDRLAVVTRSAPP